MGTSEIHKYNLKSNIFFGMNTLVVGEMVLRILKIEYLILNIDFGMNTMVEGEMVLRVEMAG